MLIEATRVFARSVQVEGTKRAAEIDRVAVELRIGLFELVKRDEIRAESVAAQTTQRTLIFGWI